MQRSTDIVIAGGGISGLTTALALSAVGMPSTILDPAKQYPVRRRAFDGRAYAISQASRQMLEVLGIWQQIAARATPITEIKVSAGEYGQGATPFIAHFNPSDIDQRNLGHMVEERDLIAALAKSAKKDSAITPHLGVNVTHAKSASDGVELQLSDGTNLNAGLLIGADGRGSTIAADMGMQKLEWDYPQAAIVCAVEHKKPHDGIAHQFFAPEGPLAILPLGTHVSSLVWTAEKSRVETLCKLPDSEYLKALRPAFGDFLGPLKLVGSRFNFPLALSLAYEPVAPNVALISDAAHGIHPLAGQGLNLGFGDIAALVEILAEAKWRGEDYARLSVLKRYAAWRRKDIVNMGAATDGLNRIFSTAFGAPSLLPQIGLAIAQASAPMRKIMMQKATGVSANQPKLLRGILP